MHYRKTKWFVYTVAVGLIPLFTRGIVYLFLEEKNIGFLLNEMDFVIFGLVVHITNINELEHFESPEKAWKTLHNGLSILFIVMYGVIFGTSCVSIVKPDMFDKDAMVFASFVLSVSSFVIGYSLFDRMSKMGLASQQETAV